MTIKTTELLDLLSKATQLGLSYEVKENKDVDYKIRFFELYTNNFSETTFITKEGVSDWGHSSCVCVEYLMETFDSMLKQKEEEKLKEQKRQELLDRLTDEEKDLLGVK